MSIHGKSRWTFCKAKWSDAIFKFCWIEGLLNTDNFINFCDKLNSETNTRANKSKRAHFWTDQCINFNEGPICLVRCVVCLRSSKYYEQLNYRVSLINTWALGLLYSCFSIFPIHCVYWVPRFIIISMVTFMTSKCVNSSSCYFIFLFINIWRSWFKLLNRLENDMYAPLSTILWWK